MVCPWRGIIDEGTAERGPLIEGAVYTDGARPLALCACVIGSCASDGSGDERVKYDEDAEVICDLESQRNHRSVLVAKIQEERQNVHAHVDN